MPLHCLQCGTPLTSCLLEDRLRDACPSCGWVYYTQLKVGAGAIIFQDGRILLLQRASPPWQGTWNLPAGFVEADEDPRRAAERETMEETGLSIRAGSLVDAYYHQDDSRGCGVFLVYEAQVLAGAPTAASETSQAVFFAPADAWDKVVILSPQPQQRVVSETETKAGWAKGAVLVPVRTRGAGRTISGTVSLKELGEGDPAKWGYQVVLQSNEGFPDKADLLTRKVNEFEGQHRFGGGNDGDCDPHAMDVLAGKGTGDKAEIDEQKKMLAYECEADGTAKKAATLTMVRK